ncbi:phosphate-binding protein, partial [bacterium]
MRNAPRLSSNAFLTALPLAALLIVGCGNGASGTASETTGGAATGAAASGDLKGDITLDGSSTVLPISEAVAEEFGKANSGVRPTANASGTGGGFKKFAAGEIDIAGASRPIEAEEAEACKKNGVEFVEI